MESLSTRFKHLCTTLFIILSIFSIISCNKENDNQISLSELVEMINADVFDSTSVFFGDYSKYPQDLSKLPIGVFNIGATINPLLNSLQTYDIVDNISGEPSKDNLSDLAGENFVTFSIATSALDTLASVEDVDLAVLHTLFLTGNDFFEEAQPTKIVVAGGKSDNLETTLKLKNVLSATNTGVRYISVVEATAEAILDKIQGENNSFAVAYLGEDIAKKDTYSKYLTYLSREREISLNVPVITQSISERDEAGIPMVDAALISLLRNYRLSESSVPIKAIIVEEDLDEQQIATLYAIIKHYRSMISTGENPYKSIIAEDILIVEPNKCAAAKCYRVLRSEGNLALSITKQQVNRFSYPSNLSYVF